MQDVFSTLVARRISTHRFDPSFELLESELRALIEIAAKAPSAYNLQNWRVIAVQSPTAKARLREAAFGQAKVEAAAAVILVCGQIPSPDSLPDRLAPSVAAGFMDRDLVAAWQAAATSQYADNGVARDEAVRSATLAAAFLMLAAEARGLASCPMVGFDPVQVKKAFDLAEDELPVMLLALGKAAPGNWPQKPRRALAEILSVQ